MCEKLFCCNVTWCFYLCREQLQLNFMHQTDHYFVRLIVVSAVVIIDLMVSLLTACVKVSLSESAHWLPATISDLRLAGIRDWPADTASDRMPTNLGAWIRPPSPRLTCLSKSPVNCNDCPADWKSPAPFSLALSFCLWVPPACLCIYHALFSVLSSIAECTTMLITFLFDFTAGSWLCLTQSLWAVKRTPLCSLAAVWMPSLFDFVFLL